MELGLQQKVAVVLAASKGFGKACALALAKEGCKVAICSRNEQQIQQAAAEIKKITGGEIVSGRVDVEFRDQIDAFITEVLARWQKVDILVTNAGGPPVKNFEETLDQEWEKYFRITFMSVVWAIRAILFGNPPGNPRCRGFGPPLAAYNTQGAQSPMSPQKPPFRVQHNDNKTFAINIGRRRPTPANLTPARGGLNISEEGVFRLFRPTRRIL